MNKLVNKYKWYRRLQIFNKLLVVIAMVMFATAVYQHNIDTMLVITMTLVVWYVGDKLYKSV